MGGAIVRKTDLSNLLIEWRTQLSELGTGVGKESHASKTHILVMLLPTYVQQIVKKSLQPGGQRSLLLLCNRGLPVANLATIDLVRLQEHSGNRQP